MVAISGIIFRFLQSKKQSISISSSRHYWATIIKSMVACCEPCTDRSLSYCLSRILNVENVSWILAAGTNQLDNNQTQKPNRFDKLSEWQKSIGTNVLCQSLCSKLFYVKNKINRALQLHILEKGGLWNTGKKWVRWSERDGPTYNSTLLIIKCFLTIP